MDRSEATPVATETEPETEPKKVSPKVANDEVLAIHGWIYYLMRILFGLFFRLGGCKIHRRENVPREGPVIIAANHASLLDPPLVGVCTPRLVTTMAKSELFEKKTCGLNILGYIIQRMGAFPVRRGTSDRRALRRAIQVLKEGKALTIFPEGTRTSDGDLKPAELGIAMIAHAAQAPIVPVYLKGTERAFSKLHKGPRLVRTEVWFGQALRFEEEYQQHSDRATLQAISDRVMQEIARLRDQAHGAAEEIGVENS